MHSIWTRANAVFAFTLSVLAAMTFAAFLTTVLNDNIAPVIIKTSNAQVKNVPNYSANRAKNDLASLNFDIQVDVSPVFNWNVKQLFLYLVAEYSTPSNPVNQVVLWDKIILRGESPVIDVSSANPKYYFWDDGNGLLGNENVTLVLRWNVIPNAGYLPLVQASGSTTVKFPSSYITGKF